MFHSSLRSTITTIVVKDAGKAGRDLPVSISDVASAGGSVVEDDVIAELGFEAA